VQKFDTPLPEESTSSLEALQAFSKGRAALTVADFPSAIQQMQHATELDPNFAMAYGGLAVTYIQMSEPDLAAQQAAKAYELRDRVSERERLHLVGQYEMFSTGNLPKAVEAFEQMRELYPRDVHASINLGILYSELGALDKQLQATTEAFKLVPNSVSYANLETSYIVLDRFDEARALGDEARSKKMDTLFLRAARYWLAFFQNDQKGMAEQVAWSHGKEGIEDVFLAADADTLGYYGKYRQADARSKRAAEMAEHSGEKETAAGYLADAGIRSALLGYPEDAKKNATAALESASNRDSNFLAGLALAFAGDSAKAQAVANSLAKLSTTDTFIISTYLPVLRAQIALNQNDPHKAIDELVEAEKYDFGSPGSGVIGSALMLPYVRGDAYLRLKQGNEAASEFQKITSHRGLAGNGPNAIMAYLGLARAYALQGDNAKARVAYQDLLANWKEADPDLPVLLQAKAEYAKLH
jgi:eukaryotic-like serine/threonine-protein kinase